MPTQLLHTGEPKGEEEQGADLELLEELAQVAQAPLHLPRLLLHHPWYRPPGLVLLQILQCNPTCVTARTLQDYYTPEPGPAMSVDSCSSLAKQHLYILPVRYCSRG